MALPRCIAAADTGTWFPFAVENKLLKLPPLGAGVCAAAVAAAAPFCAVSSPKLNIAFARCIPASDTSTFFPPPVVNPPKPPSLE
jgi:hypothetical protein